jgi:hypothetical protein
VNDQLETDLRATLHRRAAQVPASSAARLTGIDYKPRTRGLAPPVAAGAAGAGALAVGAVVAVVSLGAGASNAFAGWTPTPTPPSPDQLAAASADCRSHSPIAGLPPKLTDTRGPFTFSVYAAGGSSAICISGPSFTAVSATVASRPENVPAGRLAPSISHLTNRDGHAYSFAEGRAGAGVSGVTFILDDDTKVKATVANGWFVAWWPGPHAAKAAEIATPTGLQTQTFDLNHQSPCGRQLCTGGGAGMGSSGPVSGSVTSSAGFSRDGGRSGDTRRSGAVQSFGLSR